MIPDDLLRSEAEARRELIGDLRYDVTVDLTGTAGAPTFRSTVDLEFSAARTGASTFIDLEAQRVHEVVLNDVPLDASVFAENRVTLPDLRARNRLRVAADCRYSHTGTGLHRIVDPADSRVYLYSQCEPFEAHRMFACFDQPDLKATFRLRVDAPSEWEVVSNAPVDTVEDRGDGISRTTFESSPIMSTYLVALVAGPYARVTDTHDGIELNLYCRQSLRRYLEAEEIFEITKQGLDHFADRFAMAYPFGSKYDQLFVPEFNAGAMENVACVTFNEESAIYRGPVPAAVKAWRAGTILHEMAHMWFGDLVTMRWWDDLWLNESFATYMGNDGQAVATRYDSAWVDFANGGKSWAARQDQLPTTHPVAANVADISAGRLNFDGISYAKGASVLRQLVAWVGEDSFYAGIREYFVQHRWANATLRDFLDALERKSGRDLGAWSREWLETAGMNVLRLEVDENDGLVERCSIRQEPATPSLPTLRRHRIGIGLYDLDDSGRLVRTERIELDVTGELTEITELRRRARPALVLLNDGDLTFAKIRLDDVSAQTVIDHLSDLDDALARSLLWAAMWDMTRDAEIPAHRYIELVRRHAPVETMPTIVDDLMAQAVGAVENFAHPTTRRSTRQRLHETAVAILAAAAPGSPLQLSALRCSLATMDDPADFAAAAAMLEGREVPEGVTVDQDLRWLILRRLAAANLVDEQAIAAEAARDSTDVGARKAAAARAARPDPAAKRAAWARIIDPATPLATQRSLIAGFQERDQQDLLAPYIQRWVELVPRYWRDRGAEEAEQFTQGLYPAYRADNSVIAAADLLLEGGELTEGGRRLVTESRDNTLRQQRCQEADRAAEVGARA